MTWTARAQPWSTACPQAVDRRGSDSKEQADHRIVTSSGWPVRTVALVRLLVVLGVASYLIEVGAPVALCPLAVVAVLEWADAVPRRPRVGTASPPPDGPAASPAPQGKR